MAEINGKYEEINDVNLLDYLIKNIIYLPVNIEKIRLKYNILYKKSYEF